MMGTGSHGKFRELGYQIQNLGADNRMLLNLSIFIIRKTCGLVDDGFRHTDFANIMEQPHKVYLALLFLEPTQFMSNMASIAGHTLGMTAGIGVLGIDGLC